MKIMVTGATGFVGRQLIPVLLANQHQVAVVGRSIDKINRVFKGKVEPYQWDQLNNVSTDQFDVVIHLAGENIGDHRWAESVKNKIKESRTETTNMIVNWCLKSSKKKIHLYSASAIGVYGLQTTSNQLPPAFIESNTTVGNHPSDFLSEVGHAWEKAVQPAIEAQLPVTIMRFAVVLKRGEGMLKKLELPFSLGMGMVLGSGQQAFSWIDIDDLINAIIFLINHPDIVGPINLVAPECVTQRAFSACLAKTMNRPLFLTMPAFMVKLLFGQMGEELLLGGQHVSSEKLKNLGYEFIYPTLDVALKHEWNSKTLL